ncbi:helix-turn-helix transcriptional regulator [Thermobifida halotolerans]|uniref:Helix-turn-helix transcriptional regulator n=1 Tax=Thermobifida halotolerans TaxID=483545 RepID=A0A399G733_9ACTN|nr:helix-turn-helix transcriptional regulator [Thermobifida halotolerans]UOE21056.1 helix-turn-helix transcriptional regulator [Thermobifida halotolerans]
MVFYTPFPAPADLSGDVVLGWTTRLGGGTHRLVPDGCVDVLWLDNGSVLVCGPETTAWTFALPSGTEAVGVRFRPGRAATALGLDVPEARDRRVLLEDVLGSRVQRHVAEQVGAVADARSRLRVLYGHVRGWLEDAAEADRVGETVAGLLGHDLATPVAELAREAGLSERQLHRRCTAVFGYGPATLRRILRLQRFLRLARRPGAPADLAYLACAAGYVDQPHLSRDCRAIAGVSPRQLLVGR